MTRYRNTHSWALWEDGPLLAVTVDTKGTVTLMRACNAPGGAPEKQGE